MLDCITEESEIKKHVYEMGKKLDNFRKSGLLCDVRIILQEENKCLNAHRNILASCSEYFRSLFTSVMTSSSQIETIISGVTTVDMEAIIQYAYLQEGHLTPENVESIMYTADRLNILGLLEQCAEFLNNNMQCSNVVGILHISRSVIIIHTYI